MRLCLATGLALALAAAPPLAGAPEPLAVERFELRTGLLPEPVPVTVLLPPGYRARPGTRFPALYFLHDALGDEDVLVRRGVAAALAAEMAAGTLPEMLVVAPGGKGSWFTDSRDGRSRYGTFLDRELVPAVEARFRALGRRDARAACGISMGGYGAIRWALRSPETLGVAGGLSPAVQQMSWTSLRGVPFFVRRSLETVFGRSETESSFRENDLYQILLSDPGLAARAPRFVLRCGTGDKYRLHHMTSFLDRFLRATGATSEVVLEPGGHDWGYWRAAFVPFTRALVARLSPPEEGTPP